MTIRSYQVQTIILLALLLLATPWLSFAFFDGTIQAVLWAVVVSVFGTLAGLGGMLLNYSVTDYVVGFGIQFTGSGIGNTVNLLWVIIRDIFNLTFIFGLVFIGFKMILGSDESGTRRWLINLIMAALLVNFSLFITKFIVDFTNIAASQIAHAFPMQGRMIDISGAFMNALGIQGMLGGKSIVGQGSSAGYGYIFGSLILFIISAFVFAAGGILLLIRYAALCLYMIMSPLMFIGWVFPQLQSIASTYWRGFLGRAFFAPVYLLLVYFSYKVVAAFYFAKATEGKTPKYAEMFGGADGGKAVMTSFDSTFPPFIISCIFLIASIVVANKLSADGSATAMNMGKSAANWTKRKAQGTAKFAGRTAAAPVAWGARRTSNAAGNLTNRQIDKWQQGQGIGRNKAVKWLANTTVADNAARGAATSMKNAKFGGKYTVDQTEAQKSVIENRNTNAETLREGEAAHKKNSSYDRSTHAIMPGTGEIIERSTITNPAVLAQIEAEEQKRDEKAAKGQMALNNLSTKELEQLSKSNPDLFNYAVANAKSNQFDALQNSDQFTPAEKATMQGERNKAIESTFKKNGEIITENLQNLSIKQIESLGDQFIRDNAHMFSQAQMETITKSDSFTESQKGSYSAQRKGKLIKMAADPAKAEQLFRHNTKANPTAYSKKKKPSEIANLPFEVFIDGATMNPTAIKMIDGSVLEEIYNKKTMTADQRRAIRDAITSAPQHADPSAIDYLKSAQGVRNWG
jgi:hypothetical protein